MAGKRGGDRKIIKNYTGEAAAGDIRFRILKLMMEEKERGIAADAEICKQRRNICKREP